MKLIATILVYLIFLVCNAQNDTVHVIFKTHLDVGFTDLAPEVIKKYMDEYIPKAINTVLSFDKNSDKKFIWTSGSWIISEYLRVSSPEKKAELESVIRDGLICWTAYPFTADNELMDASLFDGALAIAGDLDKQYGKLTIAAKITDVPGETIGVVHLLEENGIRLLHIGNNPASPKADTPPVFLWKDPQGGEVVLIYQTVYGGSTQIPGFHHILQFEFTNDNNGPQTPEEVREIYRNLELKYPGAVIRASNLNEYANELWKFRQHLPIVTQEIGNTWIHSAGTDPYKYATFRALMRLRTRWINEKRVDPNDPDFKQFTVNLLLMAEHTGGIDEKSTIDFDHYSVDELATVINTTAYQRMEQSWNDSRAYADKAIAALGNSHLADEANQELARLKPKEPDMIGYKEFDLKKEVKTKFFNLKFDQQTGAIQDLTDLKTKMVLSSSSPIGLFWHETFSEEDYNRFSEQYLTIHEEWTQQDFCKPNVGKHGAVSSKQEAKVEQIWVKKQKDGITVLQKLKIDDYQRVYGTPELVWIEIFFPEKLKEIGFTVQWMNKKASRLPDAYWFSINLKVSNPKLWTIEKLNRQISPLDVAPNGASYLHGFNRGVFYKDKWQSIFIESPDCPVVAPGTPHLLEFNKRMPDLNEGWHFNLLNNKWGTNFPTWYNDDARFRFTIHFDTIDKTL